MLCDELKSIITEACVRVGIPLTISYICQLLCDIFEYKLIESVCAQMYKEGVLIKVNEHAYTTRNMHLQVQANLLIRNEYQELGMTLIRTDAQVWVRYIPPEVEHRFFHVAPSTIGPIAGMGLFVRSSRCIPQGCVFCEYRGRPLRVLPRYIQQGTYVVKVRNTSSFIDGVSADSDENLSLATFINDGGMSKVNSEMVEYDRYPGRVFLLAQRDLQPNEEVFVLYGSKYWGFASYEDLQQSIQSSTSYSRRKRKRNDAAGTFNNNNNNNNNNTINNGNNSRINIINSNSSTTVSHNISTMYYCRSCGEQVLRRCARLHISRCGDELVNKKLLHLDCKPRNAWTAMTNEEKLLPRQRAKAARRTTSLVILNEPQTFSHSHEDAIRDREFYQS